MLFPRKTRDPRRGLAPTRAGGAPRPTGWALALALLGTACADTDANQVTPPVVLGMTAQLLPVYDDGQMQLYQVQIPVPLPVRKPTDEDLAGLPKDDPYPRTPFVLASDMR